MSRPPLKFFPEVHIPQDRPALEVSYRSEGRFHLKWLGLDVVLVESAESVCVAVQVLGWSVGDLLVVHMADEGLVEEWDE